MSRGPVTTISILGGGAARAVASKWVGGPGYEKPLATEKMQAVSADLLCDADERLRRLGLKPVHAEAKHWATYAPLHGEPGWWISCELMGAKE